MKFITTALVTLLGIVNVAAAQQESPEAPLEGVWPELADARLGDLEMMLGRGEIRISGIRI